MPNWYYNITKVHDMDVTGALNVSGKSTQAAVSATNISASGTLNVSGKSTQAAVSATNISASGTLDVSGKSTQAGISATDISASGTLNVNGKSTQAGISATDISASGTLGVSGKSTQAAVSATDISASGTLGVSGKSTQAGISATNVSASGTLDVGGHSTMSFMTIAGATLSGTLTLENGIPLILEGAGANHALLECESNDYFVIHTYDGTNVHYLFSSPTSSTAPTFNVKAPVTGHNIGQAAFSYASGGWMSATVTTGASLTFPEGVYFVSVDNAEDNTWFESYTAGYIDRGAGIVFSNGSKQYFNNTGSNQLIYYTPYMQ